MKWRAFILGFVALLLVPVLRCQSDSMIHVNQFHGTTVADKVSAAMAHCPAAPIPCILVVDASLAAAAQGSMPTLCGNCFLDDYRSGPNGGVSASGGGFDFTAASVSQFPPVTGDAGAAINAAFLKSSVVEISSALSPNASTTITIPNAATGVNGTASTLRIVGTGIVTVPQILIQDSTTADVMSGVLDCPDHATIKLASGSNKDLISDTNFASLTGTANPHGAFGAKILGCILDGNKANNTGAWAVRLYGRNTLIENVHDQNDSAGGIWAEEGDTGTFSSPGDDNLQQFVHVKSILNNGDGFYIPQGQLFALTDVESWGNTGWGIKTKGEVQVQTLNTFLNGSGGCDVQSGGAMIGSNAICTSQSGWGALIESGAGSSVLTSAQFGCNGCIGLELRSPNQRISGQVANSTVGVKFNGGGGVFSFVSFSDTTVFNCASFVGNPIVEHATADGTETVFDPGTCGTVPAVGVWNYTGPGGSGQNVPYSSFSAAGWSHTFPNLNGTFAVVGNAAQNTASMYMGGYYEGASNAPVPAGSSGTQVAGQVACIKSLGPPVLIGTCSGTVSATTGACGTCN